MRLNGGEVRFLHVPPNLLGVIPMRIKKDASIATRLAVREHKVVVDWDRPVSGAKVNALCITPGCGWTGQIPVDDLKL